MKATVNGLAMIVLPPNISVEEAEVLFSEVLKKLRSESAKISVINANNEAFASIFNANDLFKPSEARVILADNLLVKFAQFINDPISFATAFVSEYYGPRDEINHAVVTDIASIEEGSADWALFERKRLTFLIYQCRNILNNQR